MLNGFKFSLSALVILLCYIYSFEVQAEDNCHVKVSGTVPSHHSLNDVYLHTYNKETPITQRQFSVCFSEQDLEVNGTFIPSASVSLDYKQDGVPKEIYGASLFIQTKEVELTPITGVATRACNRRCNYYLYQKMLQSDEIAIAAQQFPQAHAKIAKDDIKGIIALNQKQSKHLSAILEKTATVQTIDVKRSIMDSPSPYSGASFNFINKNTTQLSFFKETLPKLVQKANFDREQLNEFGNTHKSDFDNLLKTGKRNWEQQVEVINQLILKLERDGTEISSGVAKVIGQTRDATEQHYLDYLTNDNRTPIPRLNIAAQPFELLMANWTVSAYLAHNDKQTFSALFTERFKAEEVREYKEATDKALSQLIYMPDYFSTFDISKGYENIQRAYVGLLADSSTSYQFGDDLHSVSFKYEKGAWRLDQISQVPIRPFKR
ncbi:hypothetical protein [Shewanella japonica]|uniref:hypothetical protein n=1 Tax=Shewanella japonica TaxID=93973 RepID=UPI000E740114|nr:hypothetical protein [Shewanella japonica]